MTIIYHPKRFSYNTPPEYADMLKEAIRHFIAHRNRLPDFIAVPLDRLDEARLAMEGINADLAQKFHNEPIPVEGSAGGILSNEIWPGWVE